MEPAKQPKQFRLLERASPLSTASRLISSNAKSASSKVKSGVNLPLHTARILTKTKLSSREIGGTPILKRMKPKCPSKKGLVKIWGLQSAIQSLSMFREERFRRVSLVFVSSTYETRAPLLFSSFAPARSKKHRRHSSLPF